MEFHCTVKVGSLGKGANCVGRCAYVSGEKLTDPVTGKTFDHTSKEEVLFSQTFLPDHAPKRWKENPVEMWASLQEKEMSSKSNNPRLYREMEISFPNEWNIETKKKVMTNICENLAEQGVCCTASLHDKQGNSHIHIEMAMRQVNENGEWLAKYKKDYALDKNGDKIPILDKNGKQKIEKKTGRKMWLREQKSLCFDDKQFVVDWRAMVCKEINKELPRERQLDHRSYAARGIDKVPTIHHYGLSDRKEINDNIRAHNTLIAEAEKAISSLQNLIRYEYQKGEKQEHGRDYSGAIDRHPGRPRHAEKESAGADFSAEIESIRTARTNRQIDSTEQRIAGIRGQREEALRRELEAQRRAEEAKREAERQRERERATQTRTRNDKQRMAKPSVSFEL